MHLFSVGDDACEAEGATYDVGNDDAAHFVEGCTLVGEPQDEQGREEAKENDEDGRVHLNDGRL